MLNKVGRSLSNIVLAHPPSRQMNRPHDGVHKKQRLSFVEGIAIDRFGRLPGGELVTILMIIGIQSGSFATSFCTAKK